MKFAWFASTHSAGAVPITSAEYIVFFGMFTTDPRLVRIGSGCPSSVNRISPSTTTKNSRVSGTHTRRDFRARRALVVRRVVVLVIDDDFGPVRLALVARLQIGQLDVDLVLAELGGLVLVDPPLARRRRLTTAGAGCCAAAPPCVNTVGAPLRIRAKTTASRNVQTSHEPAPSTDEFLRGARADDTARPAGKGQTDPCPSPSPLTRRVVRCVG